MIRALPVLLLTFLVFFNSPVWLMASTISRGRMWLALIFLSLIAAAFVVAVTIERFRPVIDAPDAAVGRSTRTGRHSVFGDARSVGNADPQSQPSGSM